MRSTQVMLVIYIFILMFTNTINNLGKKIHSTFINRITILTLLLSILYSYNTLYFQSIGKGISLYSGLFQNTVQSQIVEIVLIAVGISILFAWPFLMLHNSNKVNNYKGEATVSSATRSKEIEELALHGQNVSLVYPSRSLASQAHSTPIIEGVRDPLLMEGTLTQKVQGDTPHSDQYSLIAIFSILGGSLLMSSLDLLSMYLSIELQSFALYILATLNKERLSSTSAGLKYFLLGSLSSCLILLGSAIIYSYTGLTQFESINTLMSILNIDSLSSICTATMGPMVEGSTAKWTLGLGAVKTSLQDLNTVVAEGAHLYYGVAKANDSILAEDINKAFTIGLIILIIGFLFKISAAPFYQWAPDVYDGTPTIVTVWLTIVVKLTILIFLLGLIEYAVHDFNSIFYTLHEVSSNSFFFKNAPLWDTEVFKIGLASYQIKNLLLISSLLSLLIGTIAGLSQIKFKRLLAFSSISHVGFLLLALGIYTQKSVDSFIFYLIQYSITSLNIFLILLAFSYFILLPYSNLRVFPLPSLSAEKQDLSPMPVANARESVLASPSLYPIRVSKVQQEVGSPTDINYIVELKGQLFNNPILSISMAICLFSMAGVPPLIGFFSKQFVLFSSIENGNNFLSIIAILVSVISASYYLRLIKITFFDTENDGHLIVKDTTNKEVTGAAKKGYIANGVIGNDYAVSLGLLEVISYSSLSERVLSAGFSVSKIHSYIIAIFTLLILFFFLDPSILLNGTQLISLTIFNI